MAVNWGGNVLPADGDSVTFPSIPALPANAVIALDASRTISTLTINNPPNAYTLGSTVDIAAGYTLTLNNVLRQQYGNNQQTIAVNVNLGDNSGWNLDYGNGPILVTGAISGPGRRLTKYGSGALTLSGANSYTGPTVVRPGGALILGFNTAGAPVSNILNSASTVTMGGGTLTLNGRISIPVNSQTLSGVTLAPGASSFTITAGAATNSVRFTLGEITHQPGGTIGFGAPTGNTAIGPNNGYVTSTGNDASGILGGWATYAGTDWASNNNVNVVAFTGYTTLTGNSPSIIGAAASNVRISNASTGAVGQAAGTVTINTLLDKDAAARTVTIGAVSTLRLGACGGIYAPSGAGALTLGAPGDAGTLTAGGVDDAAGDLTIINSGTVTNNAVIADNGSGAVSLTKSGAGALVMNTPCTYTGGTYLNGGTVFFAAGTNVLATNSTFMITGGTLNMGRGIQTNVAGVSFRGGTVTNGTIVLHGSNYDGQGGMVNCILGGSAGLVKTMASSLILSCTNNNANTDTGNTYTGDTVIVEGTLIAGAAGVARVCVPGNLFVGSPTGGPPAYYAVPQNAVAFSSTKNVTVYRNGSADFGGAAQNFNWGNAGSTVTILGGYLTGGQIYNYAPVYMTGGTLGGSLFGVGFTLTSYTSAVSAVVSATLNHSVTFNVADGAAAVDLRLSGASVGSGKSITKSGSGLMTMSASSSYNSGTTVSGGTLLINNASGSGVGQGAVTVATNTTLGGIGFIGGVATYANANVTLSAATLTNSVATVAPGSVDAVTGAHVIGTLTVGGAAQTNNVTFNKFARLLVQVGTNGTCDRLVVNGVITLGTGSNTNYLDIGTPDGMPLPGEYTLATFNRLANRFVVRQLPGTQLSRTSTVTYTGTPSGNDLLNGSIVLFMPPPGTVLMVR